MSKFDLLAVFDLTATILLLVWSFNLFVSTLKVRAKEKAEVREAIQRERRLTEAYFRRLIRRNREALWEEFRRNLL